jgi:hypothetical protein
MSRQIWSSASNYATTHPTDIDMSDEDSFVDEARVFAGWFGRKRRLARGSALFKPGDRTRDVFIVQSGALTVDIPRCDGGRMQIASFHAGACLYCDFERRHLVACIAETDCDIIELPYRRLEKLSRQGIEWRLLLRHCHAFELKTFLDACYPTQIQLRPIPCP